jgi:hypothetical protein
MKYVLNSIIAGALVAGMTLSVAVFAEDGTIVAVDEGQWVVEGSDGNTYEITEDMVEAEDLQTGDMVEYEIVDDNVVGVKKKDSKKKDIRKEYE